MAKIQFFVLILNILFPESSSVLVVPFCVCVYVWVYIYVYIISRAIMGVCMCMYVCMYVCMHMCIYMCVYIYIYIYILTQIPRPFVLDTKFQSKCSTMGLYAREDVRIFDNRKCSARLTLEGRL